MFVKYGHKLLEITKSVHEEFQASKTDETHRNFLNTNYKPRDMNVFISRIHTHKVNRRDDIWLTDTRAVWWTVFYLFVSGLFHVVTKCNVHKRWQTDKLTD